MAEIKSGDVDALKAIRKRLNHIKLTVSDLVDEGYFDLVDELKSILELHYRYRFDPQVITGTEREKLKSDCLAWLDEYQKFIEH